MMRNLLLVIAIPLFFSLACRQPQSLVYKDIRHFKVDGIGIGRSGISMDLRLYNPNKYSLAVRHADIDVYVNNTFVGKMFMVKGDYRIPKTDTFLLPVKVDVDLKTVLPNAVSLLFNHTVGVKVTGKIKAGKHGLYINVPVNYEGKQEINF